MAEHYFRTEFELTQNEFANLLGIDKSAVAHAEKGRRSFSKKSESIIQKFFSTLRTEIQTTAATSVVAEMRSEQTASSMVILKKDIKDYAYRLKFNQRALDAMKKKFEPLLQSIEKLLLLQQFPEKFEEHETTWINLQIRLNKEKLRTCSLEKQHQLELIISEVKAGLAKAEEMIRQMEGGE